MVKWRILLCWIFFGDDMVNIVFVNIILLFLKLSFCFTTPIGWWWVWWWDTLQVWKHGRRPHYDHLQYLLNFSMKLSELKGTKILFGINPLKDFRRGQAWRYVSQRTISSSQPRYCWLVILQWWSYLMHDKYSKIKRNHEQQDPSWYSRTVIWEYKNILFVLLSAPFQAMSQPGTLFSNTRSLKIVLAHKIFFHGGRLSWIHSWRVNLSRKSHTIFSYPV